MKKSRFSEEQIAYACPSAVWLSADYRAAAARGMAGEPQTGPAAVPTAGLAAPDAGAATQAHVPAPWASPVGEAHARAMEYGFRP